MKATKWALCLFANILAPCSIVCFAADYPTAKQADWVAHDFRFHTGEVTPELKLHYRTIGDPSGQPILILHGSSGSGASFLTPAFAGELFGPGQPLDATRYFIILPDSIGAGGSAKPSDGLRMKFPQYDYLDMVAAQYRLVTEGLGISHMRLVIGHSMGGMQAWLWGEQHSDFMDALVPMASQPTQMSGRNWMMRRLLIEAIRRDPDWNNGDYKSEPRSLKMANALFSTATSGGTRALYKQAPTRELADRLVESHLDAPFKGDANNILYAYQAASDYNPEPDLEKITAALLVVNAADDERNPAELGIVDQQIKRIKNASYYLIPASAETRGHGTTNLAKFWKDKLADLLQSAPHQQAHDTAVSAQ